jgi:hypothetical protein
MADAGLHESPFVRVIDGLKYAFAPRYLASAPLHLTSILPWSANTPKIHLPSTALKFRTAFKTWIEF